MVYKFLRPPFILIIVFSFCVIQCAHSKRIVQSGRGVGIKPISAGQNIVPMITVHFGTDSVRLSDNDQSLLDTLIVKIKNTQERFLLVGHTDERGTKKYNLILGDKRARSVLRYFLEKQIDPERFLILSKGEENPIDSGHHPSAWHQNRRVEISYW